MFQTKAVAGRGESSNFFFKLCCLWDNVEKYCRVGQATDDNM